MADVMRREDRENVPCFNTNTIPVLAMKAAGKNKRMNFQMVSQDPEKNC